VSGLQPNTPQPLTPQATQGPPGRLLPVGVEPQT